MFILLIRKRVDVMPNNNVLSEVMKIHQNIDSIKNEVNNIKTTTLVMINRRDTLVFKTKEINKTYAIKDEEIINASDNEQFAIYRKLLAEYQSRRDSGR